MAIIDVINSKPLVIKFSGDIPQSIIDGNYSNTFKELFGTPDSNVTFFADVVTDLAVTYLLDKRGQEFNVNDFLYSLYSAGSNDFDFTITFVVGNINFTFNTQDGLENMFFNSFPLSLFDSIYVTSVGR